VVAMRSSGILERHGTWLVLGAAVLWGTTGTAQALGPAAATPAAVGVVRLLIAGPVLLAVALARGRPFPAMREVWAPAVIAAVGMAVYQPAFFTAVDRTGVALGTVVAIGSAPVLTGVIGWRTHRPTARWATATAIAVTGVALIAMSGGQVGVDVAGVGFAMLAGLAYAVYVVSSVSLVRKGSASGAMAVVFVVAALLSLPGLALVELRWVTTVDGAVMALHLGVVTTAVAYLLFGRGLRTTGAATAATLTLGEPITATILGVAVLGERPGPIAWLGVALVLTGLAAAVRTTPPAVGRAGGVAGTSGPLTGPAGMVDHRARRRRT
jgi:drug/metabolite transporter, DME family